MIKRLFLSLCILIGVLQAKTPELTPHSARKKAEEILKSHVNYQKFTPELAGRALKNLIEELDATYTYFIESEVTEYENPSEELLDQIAEEFRKEQFTTFQAICDTMIFAIDRRNKLEGEIDKIELPTDVKMSDFKDITWATSEEELKTRLIKIRALQLDAGEKLDIGTKEQFLKKLNKRRKSYEQEIVTGGEQHMLTMSLKAISGALDNHTVYFTPTEAQQFMIQVQQRLFGIGAQLRDDLNGFTLVRLLEGGPARNSGKLKVNDRIIAVNKEPIIGMDLVDGVELIRGPQGTPVTLTILRENDDGENETFDIDIIRDEIVIKEARFEKSIEPFGDGVIAHIRLFSFYQTSSHSAAGDITQALDEIKKDHKVLGVVLDMRNNAGGVIPQAVAVTGLFIKKGVVVSVKDNNGNVQHLRNFEAATIWDGPLIVLTNKGSASAAEIVAQTLKDYGRALVVGDERTFGKGSYQTFTLDTSKEGKVNPQGEFKVTRGLYYTVSGKSPQLHGTPADVTIPGALSQMDIGEAHSKYPLESNEIESSFLDTFSDVHPFHRARMVRLAKDGAQEKADLYGPYLEGLKKNSEQRITMNQNYQNFLKEIKKEDFDESNIEKYGQNDLQLEETMNVMKDLIILSQKQSSLPQSS